MKLENLTIIQTVGTLSTINATGCLGLGGTYLILDTIEFLGETCKVILDWDGENEGTFIVPVDNFNTNDVEEIAKVHQSDIGEYSKYVPKEKWYSL